MLENPLTYMSFLYSSALGVGGVGRPQFAAQAINSGLGSRVKLAGASRQMTSQIA